MIDPRFEVTFPVSRISEHVPRVRGARKLAISTGYRWISTGVRGVVLESLMIGGTRCTSEEALQRFFERLTSPPDCDSTSWPSAQIRTAAQRRRDSERAGRELEASGA